MKCIYCKNEITEPSEEHLFPKAFGCSKSYKLDCICKKCNNELGEKLINFISYDSIEGISKHKQGNYIKPLKQDYRRVLFKIPLNQTEVEPFNGAYIFPNKEGRIDLFPQIGVKKQNIKKFYMIEELFSSTEKLDLLKEKGNQIIILAKNDEIINQILNRIKNLNITLNIEQKGKMSDCRTDKAFVECHFEIDKLVARTFVYLGFNILTYRLGCNVTIKERFDPVRDIIFGRNIHYSKTIVYPEYSVIQKKIKGLNNNHWFSIGQDKNMNIFVKVSLYNSGIIHNINFGKFLLKINSKKYKYDIRGNEMIEI